MFANGYVGTTQDSIRIRRQEKQREEQRKKYADLTKEKQSQVQSAGLREFGVSSAEAYEAAFKNETVGLVTREEFMRKQATIQVADSNLLPDTSQLQRASCTKACSALCHMLIKHSRSVSQQGVCLVVCNFSVPFNRGSRRHCGHVHMHAAGSCHVGAY